MLSPFCVHLDIFFLSFYLYILVSYFYVSILLYSIYISWYLLFIYLSCYFLFIYLSCYLIFMCLSCYLLIIYLACYLLSIFVSRFSLSGGQQLECDVVTGFFPIFGEFTNSPKSYFHHLMVIIVYILDSFGLVKSINTYLRLKLRHTKSNSVLSIRNFKTIL